MTEQNAAGYQAGMRHGWMDSWCGYLSRVLAGDAASALLAAELPLRAGVVVLPSWVWESPQIDVGRKDHAQGGGRLRLPIRVQWDSGPVQVVPLGDTVKTFWQAEGLGIAQAGQTSISCTPGSKESPQHVLGVPPDSVIVEDVPRSDLVAKLAAMVQDGAVARWEAVGLLETYVSSAVSKAHAYISKDVGGADAPPLLDQIALDEVCDQMVVGSIERGEDRSPLLRIVDNSLRPEAYLRVDPARAAQLALRRDAQQLVRRKVGDPKAGSKIRALARAMGFTMPYRDVQVQAILAEYRLRHPAEKMGIDRVRAALSVAPTMMSPARTFRAAGIENR